MTVRRSLRWLAGAVLVVLGWLVTTPPAIAVEATAVPLSVTCDASRHEDPSADNVSERGPPTTYDYACHDIAAGFGPDGSSARPKISATHTGYDYDDTRPFVQVARAAGATETQAEVIDGELSSLPHGQVAANGGQKWAYRGVGRDHPGYNDALKGRVNPRNPNGTATPEQHNLGNTTDSPYTSWTRDPAIAKRFAGEDGVVLRVPRGEGSPYKFEWSPDVFYEQEILIRGPVCGALIC